MVTKTTTHLQIRHLHHLWPLRPSEPPPPIVIPPLSPPLTPTLLSTPLSTIDPRSFLFLLFSYSLLQYGELITVMFPHLIDLSAPEMYMYPSISDIFIHFYSCSLPFYAIYSCLDAICSCASRLLVEFRNKDINFLLVSLKRDFKVHNCDSEYGIRMCQ